MQTKTLALSAAVLSALFAGAACSGSGSDSGLPSATTSGSSGGEAGSTANNGGRSGSAHGGAGGKAGGSGASSAGSTSRGGSSGSGGSGAHSGSTSSTAGDSSGGEGGASSPCAGCASGLCLADGTCVDCLPSNDKCPANEYCTAANTCAPGCKTNGSTCTSGVCDDQHDCKSCINDGECSAGRLCGGGVCAAACTTAQEGSNVGCGSGLTCCSAHCTDLGTDVQHCGVCGTACGGSQFCGLAECSQTGEAGAGGASGEACAACHDLTLANVCSISKAIVILDTTKNSSDGNRKPGRAIGAALAALCTPAPTVTEEEQDSQDALSITTGHPVAGGGSLLIVAGGPYFQTLEAYFEQTSSPLYLAQVGDTQQFTDRATGAAVVSRSASADNLSHDFFIIQFMRDTSSGSLTLNAQGFWESGTVAATYQLVNVVLPALSTFDKAWYAYEWTDMNGDMAPDADEITLKGTSP
jgi:hypothetical protein